MHIVWPLSEVNPQSQILSNLKLGLLTCRHLVLLCLVFNAQPSDVSML